MTRSDRRVAWVGIVLALGALLAAWMVHPVPGDPDHLTLFGLPFGQACPFRSVTGLPCPSCGMTRSWVWAARGQLTTALRFNAAGVGLLAGILVNAIVRVLQLAGVTLPKHAWSLAVAGGIAWLVVWMVGWGLRLAGYYPLA
jgi:hypothetical protein